jgi:hypothetical protein
MSSTPTPTPSPEPASGTTSTSAILIVIGLTVAALVIAGIYYLIRYKTNWLDHPAFARFNSRTRVMTDSQVSRKSHKSKRKGGSSSNIKRSLHEIAISAVSGGGHGNNNSGIHYSRIQQGSTGQTTWWNRPEEIAIPGFMKAKEEVDFQVLERNTPLQKGGSAAIYKVKILQREIRARMVREDVDQHLVNIDELPGKTTSIHYCFMVCR